MYSLEQHTHTHRLDSVNLRPNFRHNYALNCWPIEFQTQSVDIVLHKIRRLSFISRNAFRLCEWYWCVDDKIPTQQHQNNSNVEWWHGAYASARTRFSCLLAGFLLLLLWLSISEPTARQWRASLGNKSPEDSNSEVWSIKLCKRN